MTTASKPAAKSVQAGTRRVQGTFGRGVFISYRRKLSGHAGHLFGKLKAEFGARRVFFDERAIPKGADFPDEIDAALMSAAVILVVVAPQWADQLAERATRPEVDWVLHEVQCALRRRGELSPPAVHVVLVGGAVMPAEKALAAGAIADLCRVNALRLDSEVLDDDDSQFQALLANVRAGLPQETAPVDLALLAEAICRDALETLGQWTESIRDFKSLHDRWSDDFDPPESCRPVQALGLLRTRIEDGRKARRLSREGLDPDRAGMIRDDCVTIVAELLRLGACQLAARADVLGDHHRPAELESLATQLFAVAYHQKQRRASIRFEPGSMGDIGRIPVEGALDQRVVTAGVLEDQSSDIVDQLWELVPEFRGRKRTYPKHPTRHDQVSDLASALRQMNDDDRARVSIALQGSCAQSTGAQVLRTWLARMRLDVDVLVRTGTSHAEIADQEKDLIVATWRCLQQIEGIGGERPK